jgi:hypothetical protein
MDDFNDRKSTLLARKANLEPLISFLETNNRKNYVKSDLTSHKLNNLISDAVE